MRLAAQNMRIVYQVSSDLYSVLDAQPWAKTTHQDDGDDGQERSSLLWSGKGAGQQEKKVRLVKAALYALQVFYSFFIMWVYTGNSSGARADHDRLLFMTYNGWVMLAVAVGAFVGYIGFGNSSPTKSVACH